MYTRRSLSWLLAPLLAVLLAGSANAATTPESRLEAQRALFKATEEALNRRDRDAFSKGLEGLADYPLQPYLLFADLESRLSRASGKEVREFLKAHADTPYAERLRHAWLNRLAREERWAELTRDFHAASATPTLSCLHRQALLNLGHDDEALRGVEQIWLSGRSLPDACDPVLDAWRKAGQLSTELAWGRFSLAMEAGQPGLARYISRYLPEAERAWAQRWLDLYRRPAQAGRMEWKAGDHPRAAAMLVHTWTRLARQEPEQALEMWQRYGQAQELPEAERLAVERTLALRLVLRTGAESLPHLAGLPAEVFDAQLREWQVRAALSAGDWQTVQQAIAAMTPEQRDDHAWRYWRARALEATGQSGQARALYGALAEERNFYGFMAADRAGLPYRISHRPLEVPAERLDGLASRPELQRVREWVALERGLEARREWERVLAGLDREDLKAAALLAHRWDWHDRAIFAAARANEFDDMDLRFPLAHARLMLEQSARQGINPAWAMAVARQESAFMVDARSHAGALGLMQVMPDTGRAMARHVNMTLRNPNDLLDPRVNVPIGTYYLRRNLDRFGGHPILSTAAYNAGAHRVSGWLPKEGSMDADIWAELIPFPETRGYVRRVLAYQVIYEMRLGLPPTRISSLLPPITAQSDLEASRLAHNERWDNGGLAAFTQVCDAPGYEEIPCS